MTRLNEKAFEAALPCYSEGGCSGLDERERREVVTDIITAYLAALPASDHAGLATQLFEQANHVSLGLAARKVNVAEATQELISLARQAATALSAGVRVKGLDWHKAFWNHSDVDNEHIVEIWEAFGAGHIQGWVEQQRDGCFYTEGEQFATLASAQAAVQRKHDSIILSSLSHAPVAVTEEMVGRAHAAYAKTTGGTLDGHPMRNALTAALNTQEGGE